jgi:hypothetical protein
MLTLLLQHEGSCSVLLCLAAHFGYSVTIVAHGWQPFTICCYVSTNKTVVSGQVFGELSSVNFLVV